MDNSLLSRIEQLEARAKANDYLIAMLVTYLHGKHGLDLQDFVNRVETTRHTYRVLHQLPPLDQPRRTLP